MILTEILKFKTETLHSIIYVCIWKIERSLINRTYDHYQKWWILHNISECWKLLNEFSKRDKNIVKNNDYYAIMNDDDIW